MMLNIKIIGEPKAYVSYNHPSRPLLAVVGIGYFFIFSESPLGFLNVSFLNLSNTKIERFSWIDNVDQSTFISTFSPELNWDSLFISIDQICSLGYVLYSHNALLLVITSIILLLGMVGPITLCYTSNNSPPLLPPYGAWVGKKKTHPYVGVPPCSRPLGAWENPFNFYFIMPKRSYSLNPNFYYKPKPYTGSGG